MSSREFGKYRLIAELGHGGMADVFLAVSTGPAGLGFSKLTVIKRLRPNLVEDPQFLAMLIDEARIAARLNHPNLVQTHEVGQVGDQYFIAMEYLDGQPLHRVQLRATRRGAPVPPPLQFRALSHVLAGLHYAHELKDFDGSPMNVVHRDVTPHNVFITYDGQVKIVDFGIAKAAGRASETRTGVVKGKVTYMAPEQTMLGDVDRRADIFSVGVMLWEAATGARLWKGLPDLQIMQRLVDGDIPWSAQELSPEVPEGIRRICARALAHNPDDRYPTAIDFQNDLDAFLEDSSIGGPLSTRQAASGRTRELGKYVAELFVDKRAVLKGIIERQLASPKSDPVAGQIASTRSGELPSATFPPRSTQGVVVSASQGNTAPTIIAPRAAGASRVATNRRLVIALAAIALGAGITVLARIAPPVAPSPSQAGETPPAPAPTAAPQRGTMTLILRAAPPSAKFSIDDGPLLDNPHLSELPLDGAEHVVRIEAPGHVGLTKVFTAHEDARIDVTLEKIARPATAIAPPRVPAVRPKPAPTAATKRQIDVGDPWDADR